MPWAQDPSETLNSDLFHSLHPITPAEHKKVRLRRPRPHSLLCQELIAFAFDQTVSNCASQLSLFRNCVQKQPIQLEDHVAAANCADIFSQLRSCSERTVREAGLSRLSAGSKTPVEQARFQLAGSFA